MSHMIFSHFNTLKSRKGYKLAHQIDENIRSINILFLSIVWKMSLLLQHLLIRLLKIHTVTQSILTSVRGLVISSRCPLNHWIISYDPFILSHSEQQVAKSFISISCHIHFSSGKYTQQIHIAKGLMFHQSRGLSGSECIFDDHQLPFTLFIHGSFYSITQ